MGLSEVREKINDVDDRLMTLLDERAECSVGVADAKLKSGDLIFKPEREQEICDKFASVGKGMGANVIKSVMRNSRLIQYEMYVDAGIVPADFKKMISEGALTELYNDNRMTEKSEPGENPEAQPAEVADKVIEDTPYGEPKADSTKFTIDIDIDSQNTYKLGKPDIISILAESGVEIKELQLDDENIKATLAVCGSKEAKKRAYVLLFMLYMETANIKIL